MGLQVSPPPVTICRQRVAHIDRPSDPPECLLNNGLKLTLPRLIAAPLTPGDDVSFPLPNSSTATAEILVTKNSLTGSGRDVYQAPVGYVTQPKKDKRDEFFVAAEVRPANLGISSIFLPCKALREYFYRIPEKGGSTGRQTLYDVLQVPRTASAAELRVAFKLRQLELEAKQCPRAENVLLERAFNILGEPGLRACYNALLKDPEAPALFPYGGFGSLLVSGERSRDAQTFFARRIIAFLPERHRRRFHAPLRKCEFYSDRALYRDIRRMLELWIDPAVLHQVWDATWNRWKHLLGAIYEVVGVVKQKIRHTFPLGIRRAVKGARRAFISILDGPPDPQQWSEERSETKFSGASFLSGRVLLLSLLRLLSKAMVNARAGDADRQKKPSRSISEMRHS